MVISRQYTNLLVSQVNNNNNNNNNMLVFRPLLSSYWTAGEAYDDITFLLSS